MAANGCCVCVTFTLLLVSLILFWISFATVGPLDVALKKNSFALAYDWTTIYKPGRYMVGIGQALEPLPQTWQPLMFCKDCAQRDQPPVRNKAAGKDRQGKKVSPVNVDLEVFLYYKLKIARIPDLVQAFPMKDFKSKKFIPVSVTAIKNVIAGWSVNELLEERERLAHEIARRVNAALTPTGAYVVACYIGTVGLQDSSDTAYLEQWVAIRRKLTSEVRGQVLEIRQSTEAEVSAETRKKNVLLSTQYRYGNTTIEEKKAAGEELILKAQGAAFRALQQKLNFTQTQLLKYIYYEKVRTTKANLIAGFGESSKLLST